MLAEDQLGPICCPFQSGAILIMPTEQPIFHEEAWFYGVTEAEPTPKTSPTAHPLNK